MRYESPFIYYASRTGTRKNLSAIRAAGWRLLVSATGAHRTEGFRYALDNGAWTASQQQTPFDEEAFCKLLGTLGAGADWVAVPDIVGGGLKSLEFSLSWLSRCRDSCPRVLIPVQDGMVPSDVANLLSPTVGIFVGGWTPWKLATMATWSALAIDHNAVCHVGRVNSAVRIIMCRLAGAVSADGTNATRFSVNIPLLDEAVKTFVIPRLLMDPMKDVVVLLSGGLDSTVVAECAWLTGRLLACVHVSYGQPAAGEEADSAERWCRGKGVKLLHVDTPVSGARALSPGRVLSGPRVVPGRNLLLLSLAAAWAADNGGCEVWVGCNLDDVADYPDCHPDFIQSADALFRMACGVSVKAPLLHLTKTEVVAAAAEMGVVGTWSCYSPIDGKPCGVCKACRGVAA